MHTHVFLFLCFFYFLYFFILFIIFLLFLLFFGLGPAQPTWAGLSLVGPARSLAQASDPAGPSQQEARVDWLHACIVHSAKIINLPSHRATSHSKWMYKNESKMAYLFSRDGGDGGSAVPFVCSQPSLLLFLCFCARCSFSLFVLPCFLSPCDEALRTVLASPFEFGSGFCVVFSLFFFLCIFFLCFAGFLPSVLLSFSPCLALFFLSPARSPLLCFYRTSGSPRW